MKENFTYYLPTKIVFSQNSLEQLDGFIKKRKTLLITSKGVVARGVVNKISKISSYINYTFSNVTSHPQLSDLKVAYEQIKKMDFELILAVGGGSVLDSAKFFAVQNEKKEVDFVEKLIKGTEFNEPYRVIPIISIPTTAGTGSELTPWATVWDSKTEKKYSLHLKELFNEVAIYDPILTLSVPKELTIQTGLDSLSHALESIWNKNANEITISHAVTSAKLIIDNLAKLVQDLTNIEYRQNVLKGCMYAGLAFSQTQTAVAHAISYYITLHKGVDHGIACSFTLPLLIDNIIGKYDFIDQALIDIFGELSSKKIRQLFRSLNISTKFVDYNINDEEIIKIRKSLINSQRASNSLVEF